MKNNCKITIIVENDGFTRTNVINTDSDVYNIGVVLSDKDFETVAHYSFGVPHLLVQDFAIESVTDDSVCNNATNNNKLASGKKSCRDWIRSILTQRKRITRKELMNLLKENGFEKNTIYNAYYYMISKKGKRQIVVSKDGYVRLAGSK